jgi:NCS1 family nucleobase:cation symporter-1
MNPQGSGIMADLTNADLAPTTEAQRTWRWWHFAALWIGMVVCIPAYLLAAGLIDQGMTPLQATGTILLGNLIVLVPMLLNGHAGARYGVPYAVLLRSSFGTIGARAPALARAAVACGWYGLQTWVGGNTLLAILIVVTGRKFEAAPIPFLGIDAWRLAAFALFWLIEFFFVFKGLLAVRALETWTAPIKIVICVLLLGWALNHTGGFAPLLAAHGAAGKFEALFWPSLTAMVGFWATLALNIPDFTRFAAHQRDQVVGQALGLPAPMALLAVIAVVATAATRIVFGKAIWDPVELATHLPGLAALVGLLVVSIDTVSVNIAANLVGPAYDFSALAPRHITYRRGALITAGIGVAILPWKLIASSGGYIFTWLLGYSALLGPIAGIMIADYWLLRRTRLDAAALYDPAGAYAYVRGWNPAAFAALILGVAPSVPGFLHEAFPRAIPSAPAAFLALYPYAWFVGAITAAVVYLLAMRSSPARRLAVA